MRFVKIKYKGKTFPAFYLVVDENFIWTPEQIELETAKGRSYCEMAFLDHGQPIIPGGAIPNISNYSPPYLKPAVGVTFLVAEGGQFMTLVPKMEIVDEFISDNPYYPIAENSAVICENDPFDINGGHLNEFFKSLYPPADSLHFMFSFRHRSEGEVVAAFKNASAILFSTTFTSADWWELLLRAYIISKTKAPIITRMPDLNPDNQKRHLLAISMAEKFGIKVFNGFSQFKFENNVST